VLLIQFTRTKFSPLRDVTGVELSQ
jgi:hypothetical protein